jgi:hypothetical protein
MSDIQNALGGLWQALENLDKAAGKQEQKALKIRQQELFGNPRAAAAPANGIKIDPALLSQRLDLAIEKIEQVLREG